MRTTEARTTVSAPTFSASMAQLYPLVVMSTAMVVIFTAVAYYASKRIVGFEMSEVEKHMLRRQYGNDPSIGTITTMSYARSKSNSC